MSGPTVSSEFQEQLDACLLCGASDADAVVVELMTKGGLPLRMCQKDADRWRGFGLIVETSAAGSDGAGLRAQSGSSGSASAASRS